MKHENEILHPFVAKYAPDPIVGHGGGHIFDKIRAPTIFDF